MLGVLADWFSGFWTWQTPLSFLGGIGVHHLYVKYWPRRTSVNDIDEPDIPGDKSYRYERRRRWWSLAIALLMVLVIGGRTQMVADNQERQARETTQFALQTQACFNELVGVLKIRAHIQEDNDSWSVTQRTEFLKLFQDLLAAPPDIMARSNDDPVRQKWGMDVVQRHINVILNAQREQTDNFIDRANHPIPEPTCGLNVPQ